MSLSLFKEKKEKLIKSLININEEINDKELKEFLNEKISKLDNDRFIISVFGHYSSGKSTFLNALMGFGDEILVENELASTATITRLKYTENNEMLNKAEIKFKNGSNKIVEMEEIKEFSAKNKTFNVEDNVQEVILYIDSELLKNGVEIVDTPGFNSVYEVHTDMAKAHVNNSDASIFLFSYEKPGSDEEFKFLRDVNDKMDRIFLVLNKIDLEDRTESTVENTIDDLKYKINLAGADVKSKVVHPIAAKLEREGIKESNEEKREIAKVIELKNNLIAYLTSDENIKDRLEAPIKSVLSRLNSERESKKELLNKYSLENDKIQEEIRKMKNELDDMKTEMSDKKRSLNKSIRKELESFIDNVEIKVSDINNDIDSRLNNVKSTLSLKYLDLNNEVNEHVDNMKKSVNELQRKLIGRLSDIIDMNIDDDSEVEEIKEKLVNSIRVKISEYDKEEFEMDLDNVKFDEIEEEINKKREFVEDKRREWKNLSRKNADNREIRDKIEMAEAELKILQKEKLERVKGIGEGQLYRDKKIKERYEKRSGVFGWIANIACGEKRVVEDTYVIDDSEVRSRKAQRMEVEKEYDDKINRYKKNIDNYKSQSVRSEYYEDLVAQSREEYFRENEKFYEDQIELDKRKLELAQEVVEINVRKYKRMLKGHISNIGEDIKSNIDKNEITIRRIGAVALDGYERKIAIKSKEIDELMYTSNITPEELDLRIKEVSSEIVNINRGMETIVKVKGEVINNGN